MIKRISIVVVITALLAGCYARDFERLEANQIVMGSDTPETIKQKLGTPNKTETQDIAGKQFKVLSYFHLGVQYALEAVQPSRHQVFFFFQDKLVGHDFSSSFDIDSTDFDESKVSEIKKGTTTFQEVIELLGNPDGEKRYPLTKKENEINWLYSYHEQVRKRTKKVNEFRTRHYYKILLIAHDENGIVTEANYRSFHKDAVLYI